MAVEISGVPARTTGHRFHSLDAWRGLACLMIVALHASFYVRFDGLPETTRVEYPIGSRLLWAVSRMGIGVQLFFVISGYCIAATADNARQSRLGVPQYFIRRVRRIFPPYWAALVQRSPRGRSAFRTC
jgi:peptidoglycan/LPS O-acetylase OafA/YrhL